MSDPVSPDQLPILHRRIENRCSELAEAAGPWPCEKGCDYCCRHLSEPPRLVEREWRRLEEGLARLPAEQAAKVEARLEEVARQLDGPVICPFLDREQGACRVYAFRPTVCRTYGFYQSRGGGLFCHQVEEHASAMEAAAETPWHSPIVWGSQEAVDADLQRHFGSVVSLGEWLARRESMRGDDASEMG